MLTQVIPQIAEELSDQKVVPVAAPVITSGAIEFTSILDSVKIEIDGVFVGYTPLRLDNLEQKRIRWNASKINYQIVSGYSDIFTGQTEKVEVNLKTNVGGVEFTSIKYGFSLVCYFF